jgi:KDO2-lipid IV(A) lauroyltransferase
MKAGIMKHHGFDDSCNHIILGAMHLLAGLPYPLVLGTMRSLGAVVWIVDGFHRKVAETQMKAALGPDYRKDMPLKVFMRYGDIIIDTIRHAFMDDEEIRRQVKVSGREYLEQAKTTGRGVMLITGHIGNWEILSHLPRIVGNEFCVMAGIRSNPRIETLIQTLRKRSGATILPPKGQARMLIRELKKGRTIGFIVDNRGHGKSRIFCPFFGLPASTNLAPAFIGLKGDAVIVPVYAVKEDGKYHIRFEQPLDSRNYPKGGVQELSNDMQAWVESVVRRHPLVWIWRYSRWITRSKMRRIVKSKVDFPTFVCNQNQEGFHEE